MHYHKRQVVLHLMDLGDLVNNKINMVACHLNMIHMGAHKVIDGNHHQVQINTDLKQVGIMLPNISNDTHLTVINLIEVSQHQHRNQNRKFQKHKISQKL